MADVLVVAEVAEGKLKKTTHSAVTFARTASAALGGTYSILVLGDAASEAAAEAAKLGAAKVILVEDGSLKNYLAERFAPHRRRDRQGLRRRRRHRQRLREGLAPASPAASRRATRRTSPR